MKTVKKFFLIAMVLVAAEVQASIEQPMGDTGLTYFGGAIELKTSKISENENVFFRVYSPGYSEFWDFQVRRGDSPVVVRIACVNFVNPSELCSELQGVLVRNYVATPRQLDPKFESLF